MKVATEAAMVIYGKTERKNGNDTKVQRGVYVRYKGKAQKHRQKQSATIGRIIDTRLLAKLKAPDAEKNEMRAVDKL